MCVHLNIKVSPNMRSNIHHLCLSVHAVSRFIVRVRHDAVMQTAVLAATWSIVLLGLGVSAAYADTTMNPSQAQVTVSGGGEAFDGFSSLEYYGVRRLWSADGKTLDVIANILNSQGGGAVEVSAGEQSLTGNDLALDRANDTVLLYGRFNWRSVVGDLSPVKITRFDGGNVFAVAGARAEKDTMSVEVGRRHEIDGFFFDDYYGEIGEVILYQGVDIDTPLNF